MFLLNINGILTWSQLELQNRAYSNDLCIKCSWSVIFIILMWFWCSVFIRTAAKWHRNQLWTCACVHSSPNPTHVWCFSQGSEQPGVSNKLCFAGCRCSIGFTMTQSSVAKKLLLRFCLLSAGAFLSYLWKIDPYSLSRDLHQILILSICSM